MITSSEVIEVLSQECIQISHDIGAVAEFMSLNKIKPALILEMNRKTEDMHSILDCIKIIQNRAKARGEKC